MNNLPGKKRIIFRLFPFNRLSFPVLLNAWEKNHLDQEFEIITIPDSKVLQNFQFTTGDIILYSFMTPYLPIIHEEIIHIKHPGVLVAGGGPHITGEQELAREIGFDVLFAGPGEHLFLEFGQDILDNKVKDLYAADKNKKNNLDDFLPFSKYLDTVPPLEIMRGCSWNCKYCSVNQQVPHFRSLDSITTYLDELQRRQLKRVNFISPSALEYHDQNAPVSLPALLERCSSYNFTFIEYGIFPSEIRPGTLTLETAKLLKKCVSNRALTLGAQGSTENRLKQMNRGHSLDTLENAIEITNQAGFLANLDFIIGCPGETPGDREMTIQLINKLAASYRVKIQLHHFFPLPGSSWGYRLPSSLSLAEKEKFLALTRNGIAKAGWINNEKQVNQYFSWLSNHFPGYYGKYQ